MNKPFLSLILLFLGLTACDPYPKDPENTLAHVMHDTLRVGIAENGKWARYQGGNPVGIEVKIVEGFAHSLDARIAWVPGAQEQLIELLKEHELDLVIGGFTNHSVFKKEAGFSRPYYSEKIKLGAPPGTKLPGNIKDLPVWVEKASMAQLAVKQQNGKPIPVDSVFQYSKLIAAPEADLLARKLQISEQTLLQQDHVLVVPQGENALLEALERYLFKHVKQQPKR